MSDAVNNPKHYTSHPSGLECIELTRHMSFNRGNALKYIWRAGLKDNKAQDIEKAKWYLMDEHYNNKKEVKYRKKVVKKIGKLLFRLSIHETEDRMKIIQNIIFGDCHLMKQTAYLL